ncbi:MAG: hypothetical protein J2P55_00680 [Rhizobiales bacterium]|nr:hypothetical protein [Hyphomicrobiales bacterium]
MADTRAVLPMWIVYDRPTDFPDHYVARCHHVTGRGTRPTTLVIKAETLDALREALRNMGLTRIGRDPSDEPQIVETWL